MKPTFFQSLGMAVSLLIVGTILCYGVVQVVYLLQGVTAEIVRCETWLASGMGH
ncbi:MAG: hypothetical protein U0Y10_00230 [Spirosomataceae bacterium]